MKRHFVEGDNLLSKFCAQCAHWFVFRRQCAAFPNEIPEAIWSGDNPHTSPFPGDNGIQFEDALKPVLAEAS